MTHKLESKVSQHATNDNIHDQNAHTEPDCVLVVALCLDKLLPSADHALLSCITDEVHALQLVQCGAHEGILDVAQHICELPLRVVVQLRGRREEASVQTRDLKQQ